MSSETSSPPGKRKRSAGRRKAKAKKAPAKRKAKTAVQQPRNTLAAKPKKRAAKKKARAKKVAKKRVAVKPKPKPKRKLPPQLEANKWKPGQSGNPAGRPKRKSLEEVLRQYLSGVLEIDKEGIETTRLDLMAKVIFSEGITKRNAKVMIALMDRLWPKPIVLKTDPGEPIEVAIRPDLRKRTKEELREIVAMRKKVEADASGESSP